MFQNCIVQVQNSETVISEVKISKTASEVKKMKLSIRTSEVKISETVCPENRQTAFDSPLIALLPSFNKASQYHQPA